MSEQALYVDPLYSVSITGKTHSVTGEELIYGVNAFDQLSDAVSILQTGDILYINEFSSNISIPQSVSLFVTDSNASLLNVGGSNDDTMYSGDINTVISGCSISTDSYLVGNRGTINGNVYVLIENSQMGNFNMAQLKLANACTFGPDTETIALTIRDTTITEDINLLSGSTLGSAGKPVSVILTMERVNVPNDKWFWITEASQAASSYADVTFNLSDSVFGNRNTMACSVQYPSTYLYNNNNLGKVTYNIERIVFNGTLDPRSQGQCILNIVNGSSVIQSVSNFDTVRIAAGASLTVNTLSSNQMVYISGELNAPFINGGTIHLLSGGTISCPISLSGARVATVEAGSVIRFDIYGKRPSSNAQIGDLSIFGSIPDYSLSISALQDNGQYLLAKGASDFNKTISIIDSMDGNTLGALQIGQAGDFYGKTYELALSDAGALTLAVQGDGVDAVSGLTVGSGRFLTVSSGKTASDITVLTGGTISVISGGRVNNTSVRNNGYLQIFSGGSANSTTINSGGSIHVSSGGIADNTTVNSYGCLYVSSGGTADNTTVNSGGYLYISSGGTADNTTVNSGGYLYISSGGTATDVLWTPCEGHIYVRPGGYATFASKYSGVYFGSSNQLLSNATIMDDKTVHSSCEMNIMGGGVANNTTVSSYGYLYVSSGGTANNTTVSSYGYLYVSSGGTVNSTALINYGDMYVSSGGTANNTILNNGGMYVQSYGTANDTTVNSGGYFAVSSGGTANDVSVNSGGRLLVYGGVANNIVENGGYVYVEPDAMVSFVPNTISRLVLSNNPVATIHSGTTANSTTVNSGCSLLVSSGGTANNTIMHSGNLTIYLGGVANSTIIKDGNINDGNGLLKLSGGEANYTTVISGGWVDVSSGGTANNTSIGKDGKMFVYKNGTANDTTVTSGGLYLGYSYYNTGGKANRITIMSGGVVDVSSCGVASDITISNNGSMFVYRDGTADDTTVDFGGVLHLGFNGYAIGGIANNTTVNSGGILSVESGGVANGVIVHSGGRMDVLNDASATVLYGDSASNINVASGGNLIVYGNVNGVDASGNITLGTNANVSNLTGSFTLTIEPDTHNISLKGNDFSKAKINLNGNTGLDLSGNYFGTTDLQEIYANLGVTADDVVISHVLSAWPPSEYFAIESSDLNHGYLAAGKQTITVKFSGEINPDTISVDSVKLLSASGETGITSLQLDGYSLTVGFERPAHEGVYRLCFSNEIKDVDGTALSSINYDNLPDGVADQLRFSVSNSGPAVVKVEPAGDIVGQVSTVKVYFSKAIDPDTLLSNIAIVAPDGSNIIPTAVKMLSPSVAELTIPEQKQKGSYTVTLSGGIEDYAGYMLDQDRAGISNEPEDCFSASFNLTEVELSIRNISVPNVISVSTDNVVSWDTVNESGTAMNGMWTDGVYLSTDDKWDISDKLLATYTHTGMNAGEVLSASAQLDLGGVTEGAYYLIVRSDINNDEKDPDNAEKNYVSKQISVTVPTLTLGESMAGTVTRKGDFDVYRISGEGENISISLNGIADTANIELYVGYGYVPTREKYNQKLRRATDGVLSIPGTDSGKDIIIMVYSKSMTAETGYTLSADISPMRIDKVVQSSQDMDSEITLIVNGSNFEQGVSALLIDSNGTEYVPQSVKRASGSQLFITIEADTLSRGKYKLQLNGDKTAEMDDAVTISSSGSGKIEYSIDAPDVVGRHLKHTLYLTIRNTGTSLVDAPLVLFMPTQSHETEPDTTGAIVSLDKSEFGEGQEAFWVSTMPQGYSDSLYFSVSGEIAGQIQAGEELVVPITYNGWLTDDWDFGDSSINWNVHIVHSDNGSPLVWEDVFASSGLTENEKALLCEELRDKYGSTWGGLSRFVQDVSGLFATDTDKSYHTDNLKELLNAYVTDHLGWHQPLQEIVRESDGSGNSLTIERSWQQAFTGSGSFGYCWSWIWDSGLEVGEQGDVTVSCGNSKRLYQPTYMFTYYSAQNDGSSLFSNSKGYLLREKDGSSLQFDEQGRLLYMTDSDNNTVVCTYDSNGKIIKLTNNSTGRYLTLDRDANTGFVTEITDSLGNSTRYQYDDNGNLVEASSSDNTSTYGYYGSNEHSLTSFIQNGKSIGSFGYDEKGRLVKYRSGVSDLELTYEIGRVVITDKTTDADLILEYDSRGNIVKSIDSVAGKTVNYTYDSSGLFVSAADQGGVACSGTITFGGISFESSASVCRGDSLLNLNYTPSDGKNYYTIDGVNYFKTNRDGRALGQYDITSEYTVAACDSSTGKMLSYENFKDGVSTLYTLNEDGSYSVGVDNPAEYTISDGVKYVTRDGNGSILENGETAENMFTTGYDADGNMVYYSVSSNGKTVTTRYDEHGNVISTETEDGTVSYTYDEAGRNTSVTYEDGSRILFDYYSDGTLRSQTGSDGSRTEYDNHGNITSVANGEQTSVFINTYDDFGNLISVENDSGMLTTYTYDANGNLTGNSISDHSLTVSRTYDANGNLASLTNADGSVCYYQYDENNNLFSFTDQNGNRTLYVYDANGNTISITYADNTSELFAYDEDGNLLQWTNRAGESISYLYTDGQLTRITCADGRSYEYGYDELGAIVSAGDMTFAYDEETKTISINAGSGDSITYRQNEEGNTAAITANGAETSYSYTERGQIDVVSNASGLRLLDYDYDQYGNLVRITKGNGTRTEYAYLDAENGILSSISDYDASDNLLSKTEYQYDSYSRVISRTLTDGVWEYTYDVIGQLTGETFTDNGGTVTDTRSYSYDAAGNRIAQTVNGVLTEYTYNNLNQIATVTSGGNTFVCRYDANGNTLEDLERIYTWTTDNRVASETLKSTGEKWEYSYNAQGYRTSSVYTDANGAKTTTGYLVDCYGNILAEYLDGVLVKNYMLGNGVAGWTDADGNVYYFNSDMLGSVSGVTDSNGNLVNSYRYDAWGNLLDGAVLSVDNELMFGGTIGLVSNDSGTYYVSARNYDPITGRWLSADPAGLEGGSNLYVYTLNSPLNGIDPTGLKTWAVVASASLMAAWLVAISLKVSCGKAWDSDGNFGNIYSFDFGTGIGGGATIGVGITFATTNKKTIFDLRQRTGGIDLSAGYGPFSASVSNSGIEYGIGPVSGKSSWHINKAGAESRELSVTSAFALGGALTLRASSTLIKPAQKIGRGTPQEKAIKTVFRPQNIVKQLNDCAINPFMTVAPALTLIEAIEVTLDAVANDYPLVLPEAKLKYSLKNKIERNGKSYRLVVLDAAASRDTKGKNVGIAKYLWFKKDKDGSWTRLEWENTQSMYLVVEQECGTEAEYGVAVIDHDGCHNENGETTDYLYLSTDLIAKSPIVNSNLPSNELFVETVAVSLENIAPVALLTSNQYVYKLEKGEVSHTFNLTLNGEDVDGYIKELSLFHNQFLVKQSAPKPKNESALETISVTLGEGSYVYTLYVKDDEGKESSADITLTVLAPSDDSGSEDPNDKTAIGGIGEKGFVSAGQKIAYKIDFENDPEFATAPAQWVRVFDVIDNAKFDLDSFELDSFCIAGNCIEVGDGRDSFNDIVTLNVLGIKITTKVSINLVTDDETGETKLVAEFMAVDPATGFMLMDAVNGMLPVNDSLGSGEGYIRYSINAKTDLPHGTGLTNTAKIYFDFNDPIETPTTLNTIDSVKPTITSFEVFAEGTSVALAFTGEDADSGIAGYNILYSTAGNEFSVFGYSSNPEFTATMSGGATYYFKVQAVDNVGNVSDWSQVADVMIEGVAISAPDMPTVSANITSITNTDVILTAVFSEDSTSREYLLGGTGTWTAYEDNVTVSENTVVYFKAANAAGYESEIARYVVDNIDKTAPEKPIAFANITMATNSDVLVSAQFSEDSVVKEYSLDGQNWKTYVEPVKFTENGDIFFRGKDAAGNVSKVTTYEVSNIDKIAPEKPVALADVTAATNGDVLVSATFSVDSIKKEYSLDGQTWQTYTSAVKFTSNGTICFRGTDAAGNISEVASYTVSNIVKSTETISGVVLINESRSVMSGQTYVDTVVSSGGTMIVSSGGIANDTVVNEYGRIEIYSRGVMNDIIVNDGGDMLLSDGGVTNNTKVNSGGRLFLCSGGTATNVDWTPCEGYVEVENGAAVSFVSSYSGVYYGSNEELLSMSQIIESETLGGDTYVMSGGTAVSASVWGGYMYVWSGGSAVKTSLFTGHMSVSFGGQAHNTIVDYYGFLDIYDDGFAHETTINSRGRMTVLSGGVADNTVILSGGQLNVCGIANKTIVSGGHINVSSGGTANNITICSNGIMDISSGTITGLMSFAEGASVSAYDEAIFDFNISEPDPTNETLVDNLSVIRGTPLYTLTVSAGEQECGIYKLAESAFGFDKIISVRNTSGELLGTLTVGQTSNIRGTSYRLSLDENNVLLVAINAVITPVSDIVPQTINIEKPEEAAQHIVEYSTDNFEHAIQLVVDSNSLDSFQMPAGSYQMRVKPEGGEWTVLEPIIVSEANTEPKLVKSNEDGNADVFFANSIGTWEAGYVAQHVGSTADLWGGTKEYTALLGKNKLADIIEGSSDANILLMTDDENGDGLFVDDIYSALPGSVAEQQSRIAQIDEIRAGAGDDIVDMTSQRFKYIGEGLTIRGGEGNDTIWANKGDNWLFGDAGNDRIVGASGNDVIAGGIGNDRMHGGGGDDIFTFGENWGVDTVEQLATGSVTLWFASGDESKWNAGTMTYTDGDNSVTVKGVIEVTLKFGDDGSEQHTTLAQAGAFLDFTSERIFEETGKGVLASL